MTDDDNIDYTLSADFSNKFLGTGQDQHLRVLRCSDYSAGPVRQTDRHVLLLTDVHLFVPSVSPFNLN